MTTPNGYYGGYVLTGPFTNGSAPGISANFLNNIEDWMATVDGDIANAPSLSGSTSGVALLYQFFSGVHKVIYIYLNGFRNGGASAQNITFPQAFTSSLLIRVSDTNTFSLLSSGVAQNIGIINGFPSSGTSGGTYFTATTCPGCLTGFCNHAIDTISFIGGAASAHTGLIILEGI